MYCTKYQFLPTMKLVHLFICTAYSENKVYFHAKNFISDMQQSIVAKLLVFETAFLLSCQCIAETGAALMFLPYHCAIAAAEFDLASFLVDQMPIRVKFLQTVDFQKVFVGTLAVVAVAAGVEFVRPLPVVVLERHGTIITRLH